MHGDNMCHAVIKTSDNYNSIIFLAIGTMPYLSKIFFIFYIGGINMEIIENTINFITYLIISCWHA